MTDPAFERRALALFEAMLAEPERERVAWLDRAVEGDAALVARVLAIRDADRLAALGTGAALDDAGVADTPEEPPERIGAYRITATIGHGGMGSVYRGERDTGDFAHVVAIKVVKPGLLSPALVERFERERAILARLHHPGIAQLHDGGRTADGSPFIVMEYVDGRPLLRWLEEEAPTRGERLAVFTAMCDAVSFAHRNLVVHRDLTPSNVLVTGERARWGAKLIDFGIARPADVLADALGAGAAAETTPERASIVSLSLTPGYAAPERMTGSAVTTAADIYSLGRLLERLVPTDGDRELIAIIARATAADPAARYATVEALADDIARMLDRRPVTAVGGGAGYRIARFVSRYRIGVAAATLAMVLLVSALALTLTAYARAETARRAEAARFAELRSLATYMLFDLNGSLRRVVGNAEARVGLAARAQRYLAALADSAQSDAAIRLEAARGFIALAAIQGVPSEPNLGMGDAARTSLTRAITLIEASPLPQTVTAPDLAIALVQRATIEAHRDHDVTVGKTTLARAAATLAAIPADARTPRWMRARSELRRTQLDFSVLDQAPEAMARLARQLEAEIGDWPAAARNSQAAQVDRAYAAHYRGLRLYFLDRLAAALPEFDDAQARFRAIDRHRPNDPLMLYMIAFNAYVAFGAADGTDEGAALRFLGEARRSIDRLLAIEPRDRTLALFAIKVRAAEAQSLSGRGRHREALAIQRDVVAFYRAQAAGRRSDAGGNQIVTSNLILGNIAIRAGDQALACASHREARTALDALQRDGKAMGYIAAYGAGLAANVAACARQAPVSALRVLT